MSSTTTVAPSKAASQRSLPSAVTRSAAKTNSSLTSPAAAADSSAAGSSAAVDSPRLSMPRVFGFLSAWIRKSSEKPPAGDQDRPATRSEPICSFRRRDRRYASSLVALAPMTAATASEPWRLVVSRTASATRRPACVQSATENDVAPRTSGLGMRRSLCNALYERRPSSHIQYALTSGFRRGRKRKISPRR